MKSKTKEYRFHARDDAWDSRRFLSFICIFLFMYHYLFMFFLCWVMLSIAFNFDCASFKYISIHWMIIYKLFSMHVCDLVYNIHIPKKPWNNTKRWLIMAMSSGILTWFDHLCALWIQFKLINSNPNLNRFLRPKLNSWFA